MIKLFSLAVEHQQVLLGQELACIQSHSLVMIARSCVYLFLFWLIRNLPHEVLDFFPHLSFLDTFRRWNFFLFALGPLQT